MVNLRCLLGMHDFEAIEWETLKDPFDRGPMPVSKKVCLRCGLYVDEITPAKLAEERRERERERRKERLKELGY